METYLISSCGIIEIDIREIILDSISVIVKKKKKNRHLFNQSYRIKEMNCGDGTWLSFSL